jgi:miniconductance mechanosensitive channel
MFSQFKSTITEWFTNSGVGAETAILITDIAFYILLIVISTIAYFFTKRFLIKAIRKLTLKSKAKWDDVLIDHMVFDVLSHIIPLYIMYIFTPAILDNYPVIASGIRALLSALMILVILLTVNAALNAFAVIYQGFKIAKTRPIKGYIQIVKIIVFTIGAILILASLFGIKNPAGIIGGLGAFSAVLLLVFKDPILGFVGGIQLSANNMLMPGDWISMPKYNADGTVIDIALTTVKVQNWDKTISTIPTYSLITDSFKNWRGMEDSGGRRIKRSVNIDMKSVKFCTPEMIEKFKKIEVLKDYIESTEKVLKEYNAANNIDNSVVVNGRRQTNLGVFRAYLREYLHHHPLIHDKMTFLIRHLAPGETGIPMEVYVFSKIQEWDKYENLQADIFDHILAVIPEFDLSVFQYPNGDDFKALLGSRN